MRDDSGATTLTDRPSLRAPAAEPELVLHWVFPHPAVAPLRLRDVDAHGLDD